MGYAYAAGEEHDGAVGVHGVVGAVGAFCHCGDDDPTFGGGGGFLVESVSEATPAAHDAGHCGFLVA